jgi:GH15 family glucan-1,4-alpha-glucosidase
VDSRRVNGMGLLSEEGQLTDEEVLGNFPQASSYIGLVNAT